MEWPKRGLLVALVALETTWSPGGRAQSATPPDSPTSESKGAPTESGEVPFRFIVDDEKVRLWINRKDEFEEVCDGPCETTFAPGKYEMALSRGKGEPRSVGSVTLRGPTAVEGSYAVSHGVPVWGWLISGGLAFGGLGLTIAGSAHSGGTCVPMQMVVGLQGGSATVNYCTYEPPTTDTGMVAAGAAVSAAGAILWFVLWATAKDTAAIQVVPWSSSALLWRGPLREGTGAPGAEGFAVRVRF